MSLLSRALTAPLIALIWVYQQVISPLRGPTCRFYPSCSAYAVTALRSHGPVRGTWLSVRRLLRCHPWNPGGVDHVPPARHTQTSPEDVPSPQDHIAELRPGTAQRNAWTST